MKTIPFLTAAFLTAFATHAQAEAEKYVFDNSHSQIVFSYNHLGYSTTYGMFSGFGGEINFDAEDPAASSVNVEFNVTDMITGWDERTTHFMSDDFFGTTEGDEKALVKFTSTSIEITGETTGKITGDLTMNGMTKPITLDAVLNSQGEHPMQKKPWLGFDATTTVKRSDFGVDKFAPFVSDDVAVQISIEAMKAE